MADVHRDEPAAGAAALDDQRARTLAWLREEAARGRGFRELAQAVCSHLYRAYPHYSWVGVYMIEGDRLKLWAWDGPQPTQHVEIPLNAGLCGWAASTGQLANVPDVRKDPRYLQCFLSCQSEIVVPIARGGKVYGEIDIDSDRLAAFGAEEETFLQEACAILAERAAADAEVQAAGAGR
ncbi:putative GAF sensor protein [Thermaerobacter marianensis DSM 12885]|uniref:GAF sensor protein n=1 Tax=Thermaerobacter marianensis (strain ATCC 700841 / DSM 12885 / JCM 10246 / 7p75a) TaxID=644966 RepID=E6SGP0_THEM7|nr:GAF domain-containing protein [Thermaerobacter marianensis]ADU50586.1 putative GAF sensor protein [Thermaerobacter marianensis DSM 12885]